CAPIRPACFVVARTRRWITEKSPACATVRNTPHAFVSEKFRPDEKIDDPGAIRSDHQQRSTFPRKLEGNMIVTRTGMSAEIEQAEAAWRNQKLTGDRMFIFAQHEFPALQIDGPARRIVKFYPIRGPAFTCDERGLVRRLNLVDHECSLGMADQA